MRVVRHVQHQRGLARDNLETPRQLHHRQTVANGLRRHRQAFPQGSQHRQHARGVDQLVGAAQRRIGQTTVTTVPSGPGPLLFIARNVEIHAKTPQIGVDLQRAVQHALRRHGVTDDHRSPGAHDAGLFTANRLPVWPQQLHVVQIDAGDHGAIRVDDVRGVQPPAQTHLQNDHIEVGAGHHLQNGQRGKFEVSE